MNFLVFTHLFFMIQHSYLGLTRQYALRRKTRWAMFKIWDAVSGIFFFFGFAISKLRFLPSALVSVISNIISLFCLLAAYVTWIIASYLYPDHPRSKGHWYGFSELKEQNKIAAAFGLVAVIVCFFSIALQPLIIPALWLFVASNIFWTISQIHKIKHPPAFERDYSSTRQASYLRYAIIVTAISIITATCVTITTLFPPVAVTVVTISTILSLLLGLTAIEAWLECNVQKHKPDRYRDKNYRWMSCGLSTENTKTKSKTPDFDNFFAQDTQSYAPLFCNKQIAPLQVKIINEKTAESEFNYYFSKGI